MIYTVIQDQKLRGKSTKWKNRESALIPFRTCFPCVLKHGTVIPIGANEAPHIPEHKNCLCKFVPMRTKEVGTATEKGLEGADMYLIYQSCLPDYYSTKAEAFKAGWKKKFAFLDQVLPGKTIGGDIYQNREGKLPSSPGRIWREADIDYEGGFRNRRRILYSNDGLFFATYDHYKTFYEITY